MAGFDAARMKQQGTGYAPAAVRTGPKIATGKGQFFGEDVWDTITGQTDVPVDPFVADVSPYTDALMGLAAEYKAAPLAAPLAIQAAGSRAAREATARAASARGINSALALREAEMQNEARSRQLASDAAAAAAQETAGRYGSIADMLTGAGNLDVTGQGISAGSHDAMANLSLNQDQSNAGAESAAIGAGLNAAGTILKNSTGGAGGAGGGDVDYDFIPGGEQERLASDIRGKENIQPLDPNDQQILNELNAAEAQGLIDTTNHDYSDPVLDRALGASQQTQAADATAGGRDAVLGRAMAPRAPRAAGGGDEGGVNWLGVAAAAAPLLLSLSDRRSKTKIKPIKYSYSDRLGKDEIELLKMATAPAANRDNLGEIDAYGYRYKPEIAELIGEDTAPRVGIMAQDMERAPVGENVVQDTANGKALDVNRALGFSLAGLAGLDKRMRSLELELPRIPKQPDRGDDRMELGFDEEDGIFREIGSVKGETRAEALERERLARAAGMR